MKRFLKTFAVATMALPILVSTPITALASTVTQEPTRDLITTVDSETGLETTIDSDTGLEATYESGQAIITGTVQHQYIVSIPANLTAENIVSIEGEERELLNFNVKSKDVILPHNNVVEVSVEATPEFKNELGQNALKNEDNQFLYFYFEEDPSAEYGLDEGFDRGLNTEKWTVAQFREITDPLYTDTVNVKMKTDQQFAKSGNFESIINFNIEMKELPVEAPETITLDIETTETFGMYSNVYGFVSYYNGVEIGEYNLDYDKTMVYIWDNIDGLIIYGLQPGNTTINMTANDGSDRLIAVINVNILPLPEGTTRVQALEAIPDQDGIDVTNITPETVTYEGCGSFLVPEGVTEFTFTRDHENYQVTYNEETLEWDSTLLE